MSCHPKEALKPHEVIRVREGEELAEEETTDPGKVSTGTEPGAKGGSRHRLRTIIMGIGVVLVIIGAALTMYAAAYEEESVMIALSPAFIGVIVIVVALRGKALRR